MADLLLRGSHDSVTLIAAPADFGKTTLLASWFATALSTPEDDHLVARVALDERDRTTDLRVTSDEVACYLSDLIGFDLTAADMSPQP